MQRSERRVLTTHTGSLPRPLELTRLYARRSRGEAVSCRGVGGGRQGGAAVGRCQAGRGRHRRRQQRRAAARFLPALCARPPERARRHLDAAAARRCRALSDLQAAELPGQQQQGVGRRHSRPDPGARRDPLSRCRAGRRRMRGLQGRAGEEPGFVRGGVPDGAVAGHGVGDRSQRALSERGGLPRGAGGGLARRVRDHRQ